MGNYQTAQLLRDLHPTTDALGPPRGSSQRCRSIQISAQLAYVSSASTEQPLFRFDRTDSNWTSNISTDPSPQLPDFYRSDSFRLWLDFKPGRLELVITLVESLLGPLCLNVLLQTWPSSPFRRLPKPPLLEHPPVVWLMGHTFFNRTNLLASWAARSLTVAGFGCFQKLSEAAAGQSNGCQRKPCKGAAQLYGGKQRLVSNAFIRRLEA